jgi:hypothetical protein
MTAKFNAVRLHRVGRWWISIRTSAAFYAFGFERRSGAFFGRLPHKPTHRARIGWLFIERTTR